MATALTEPFPPLVLQCLGSRHHAIREAAARSLANLCSEDQAVHSSSSVLMEQCKRLLEQSLNGTHDWNIIDGALLAISNALVNTSDASKKAFLEMAVETNLFHIVMLDKAPIICLPCCLATSIETLVVFSNQSNATGTQMILMTACQGVISRKEIAGLIGGAKVYATAARALCKALQPRLWKPSKSDWRTCLDETRSLLTCSTKEDVRLAAVKFFKKDIYNNIDQLLACNGSCSESVLNP